MDGPTHSKSALPLKPVTFATLPASSKFQAEDLNADSNLVLTLMLISGRKLPQKVDFSWASNSRRKSF
jgi:hypothetical protein